MYRLSISVVFLCLAVFSAARAAADGRLHIDWTQPTGAINRAVFGIEGFPKVFAVAQRNPRLMETFLRLNPSGQVARAETWIGFFEPENDNDDPGTFDWSRLHPERMTRFIEDRDAFADFLVSIDAELMPLVCYNTEWLESGDETDPVGDKDEWVEFAAGVTHAWNVLEPEAPQVQYVEVWNEPNMPMFYGGSRASYFEIFRKTAERYHRDYPGVQVGGPALTPAHWAEPEEWYRDFIEQVGEHADFVTHHIYHGADVTPKDVAAEVVAKTDMFRALPGKENGKLALTETDAWFNGWGKTQYLLGRHFAFLDIQDCILAVMHFTTLAYNESGKYVFGVMTEPGAPLADTYWPIWMTRNLAGEMVQSRSASDAIKVVATHHRNDHRADLFAALVWNASDQTQPIELSGQLPESNLDAFVLRVDRLTPNGVEVEVLPTKHLKRLRFELPAGQAVALTLLSPGERHFAFSDLNDQEAPAVQLTADALEVTPGGEVRMKAVVTNTLNVAVRGHIEIQDLPAGWGVDALKQHPPQVELQPWQRYEMNVTLRADADPPPMNRMAVTGHAELGHLNHAVAPVAVWVDADGRDAVSLPVDLAYVKDEPDDHPQPE